MNNEYKINDESWQAAKDIIVESVLSGKFSKDYEVAKGEFKYGLEERGGPKQKESVVDIAVWIPKDAVPKEFDLDEFENYLDDFDEERVVALQNGALPTRDEFGTILFYWLSNICEFQEADCINAYGLYPLTHSDGKQCFFLQTVSGYSMSLSVRIEGYFLDIESAFGYLRKNGFICADCSDVGAVERFINEHLPKEKKEKARPSSKKRERPHRMGMSLSPEQQKMFRQLAKMRAEASRAQLKQNTSEDE